MFLRAQVLSYLAPNATSAGDFALCIRARLYSGRKRPRKTRASAPEYFLFGKVNRSKSAETRELVVVTVLMFCIRARLQSGRKRLRKNPGFSP
jgi:hypothetical protein